MLFDTPYYLEPEKSGRHAYALLRDALVKSGKVGIAQVVLRTRARLAALSPNRAGLVVELLRYPHELLPTSAVDLPAVKDRARAGEMKAAELLIGAMEKTFDPNEYKDDYEAKLRARRSRRVRAGRQKLQEKPKGPRATNVVDLVEVLQRSLAKQGEASKTSKVSEGKRRPGAAKAGPARQRRKAS